MLGTLGGKSVNTVLGLNIMVKLTCVCVCGIMQAPCFVPEIIFPHSCLFVVKGILIYMGCVRSYAIAMFTMLSRTAIAMQS